MPQATHHDISKRYPEVIVALEKLGTTVRGIGPLGEKTSQHIQLAAAVATKSEGSAHFHTHRALKAGTTREEIYHTLLLISTVGFPHSMVAISWCRDILEWEGGE